jgi:hypothetical protein
MGGRPGFRPLRRKVNPQTRTRGLYSGVYRLSGQNLQASRGQFRVTVRLMQGVDDIAGAVNDLPVPVKSQVGAVNLSHRQNRSVIIKPAAPGWRLFRGSERQ